MDCNIHVTKKESFSLPLLVFLRFIDDSNDSGIFQKVNQHYYITVSLLFVTAQGVA